MWKEIYTFFSKAHDFGYVTILDFGGGFQV